jgi:hypothetical protein
MDDMVRYNFPIPEPDRWMAAFDLAITRVDEQDETDAVGRTAAMGDAMTDVLAVGLLARADSAAGWVQDRIPSFWAHVRDELRKRRPDLAGWLGSIDIALWQRNRDGWYQASMGRSAAEIVVQDVDDGSDRPLVSSARLAEVDQEMREIGPSLNAVPHDAVPIGIPASHWWWTIPEGPDATDMDEFSFSY